jgi:hypothetical protein
VTVFSSAMNVARLTLSGSATAESLGRPEQQIIANFDTNAGASVNLTAYAYSSNGTQSPPATFH